MCTGISFQAKDHYFGRNLDLECSYNERVVITPRNFKFDMRHKHALTNHYALIGMATVINNYPLYYEATNEKGLSMAGLNFPQNADYKPYEENKDNISPFEFIPWVLGQCSSIDEVKGLLSKINLVNTNYSEQLPLSPLHWIISDEKESITVESVKEGLKVYKNPYGVLTNNPTFDYHLMNMNHYMHLHEGPSTNQLSNQYTLDNYSLGLGAFGLPGDYSSASRFVRATYVKSKSAIGNSEKENVNQFFHILMSVAMPLGCVLTKNGEFEYTRYSCCCNTNKQIYYYTTYYNSSITSIHMHDVDLDSHNLFVYDLNE